MNDFMTDNQSFVEIGTLVEKVYSSIKGSDNGLAACYVRDFECITLKILGFETVYKSKIFITYSIFGSSRSHFSLVLSKVDIFTNIGAL